MLLLLGLCVDAEVAARTEDPSFVRSYICAARLHSWIVFGVPRNGQLPVLTPCTCAAAEHKGLLSKRRALLVPAYAPMGSLVVMTLLS